MYLILYIVHYTSPGVLNTVHGRLHFTSPSLPEDEERSLSAGLDNLIDMMVEAEPGEVCSLLCALCSLFSARFSCPHLFSFTQEGEDDEGIGDETGVYYSDRGDAIICRVGLERRGNRRRKKEVEMKEK